MPAVTPREIDLFRMSHPQPPLFPFADIAAMVKAIQLQKTTPALTVLGD